MLVHCAGAPSARVPEPPRAFERAPATVETRPASPAYRVAPLYDGELIGASRVQPVGNLDLEKRVLDATFAKYLTTAPCPPIGAAERAKTWVELDLLQGREDALGHLRPRVLRRVDGRFTERDGGGIGETVFMIDPGHCVNNGSFDRLYVVFDRGEVDGSKKLVPRGRAMTSDWHPRELAGVVERDGVDLLIETAAATNDELDASLLRFEPLGKNGSRSRLVVDARCRLSAGRTFTCAAAD
jgi:hypothetical protein